MASSGKNSGGEEEAKNIAEQLEITLKEGERLVGPTRRPDGTLRKPIRIRAGYVPQEEVAIYQSKGALWKKEIESQVGPPGFDPETEAKPNKSKSLKRNERKKEKRQQVALERAKSENSVDEDEEEKTDHKDPSLKSPKSLESVSTQISQLSLSTTAAASKSSVNPTAVSDVANAGVDIDKKIRALKKKIRLAEAQLQKVSPEDMKLEQLEKIKKLEGWRDELRVLEGEKTTEVPAS